MDVMIETTDLISVIVPFLNGGTWLLEALQSVISQTYTNWELIVIDDGSQPYHSQMAVEFCRQHKEKICYIEHEGHCNRGVSASRNEAAKLARGKYLAFLDADDKWLPAKLETQLRFLKTHPQASMACEGIIKWYSWQDKNANDYVHPIGVPAGKCYLPLKLTKLLYPFTEAAPPAPSGFMIKKETFERIGGFESSYHGIYELYEDQAFLAKMYLQEVIYIAGTANVMYRKREDSMCSAAADIGRYQTVRAFFFNWLQNYMAAHRMIDNEVYSLIEEACSEPAQAQVV